MRTFEVLEQTHSSEWKIMTTKQVAAMTAKEIYEKYFAVKPFVDFKSRNLTVNDRMRVYMTKGEEYVEYMQAVVELLLERLGLSVEEMMEKGGEDGE